MPEQNQMRPSSPQQAPDTATTYERARPEKEAGMGRLDNNTNATPTDHPDHTSDAVKNAQDATRQINAHEVVKSKAVEDPNAACDRCPQPGIKSNVKKL